MLRGWVVLVFMLVGCKRDPNEWPPREVRDFEQSCPQSFGDVPLCKCIAPAIAKRVPYGRAGDFIKASMEGAEFADVLLVLKEEIHRCARGREKEKWPERIRLGFMQGCMHKEVTREACECVADVAEKNASFADYLGWGLDMKAGLPASAEMTALFTAEKAVRCIMGGLKWTPDVKDKVMSQCRTELEGTEEECRCYADKMSQDISMSDFYVIGSGLDGGAEITARVEAKAPGWWHACTAPPPGKKRR